MIDDIEYHHVLTVDIPVSFMQAGMESETLHMNMGRIEEILIKLDPMIYWEYIRTEKGKYVLYVDYKKARVVIW